MKAARKARSEQARLEVARRCQLLAVVRKEDGGLPQAEPAAEHGVVESGGRGAGEAAAGDEAARDSRQPQADDGGASVDDEHQVGRDDAPADYGGGVVEPDEQQHLGRG